MSSASRKLTMYQQQRNEAMPEVRALVKKWSVRVVGGCLNRIRALNREVADLERAEKRVADLKRRINIT